MIKSNLEKKGFLSAYRIYSIIEGSHDRKSRQEFEAETQCRYVYLGCSPWLAQLTFLRTCLDVLTGECSYSYTLALSPVLRRVAHGTMRKEEDTCLASQISQISLGDQQQVTDNPHICSCSSYTAQTHLSRDGTAHSGLILPALPIRKMPQTHACPQANLVEAVP